MRLIPIAKKYLFLYNIFNKIFIQRRAVIMKSFYNQKNISNSLQKFFKNFSILSLPHIKNLSYIIFGMISAESVVTSDISKKLKDDFSFVQLESIDRRFRRFFNSFSSIAYSFSELFISDIISKFSVKHSSKKIHISFDHMFCRDNFTVLLFSLRIGKQRHSSLVSLFPWQTQS